MLTMLSCCPNLSTAACELKPYDTCTLKQRIKPKSAYTFLTVGMADTFTGDQIQWQENRPLESHRRSHIALENGHWAVRDGFGTIYDFH